MEVVMRSHRFIAIAALVAGSLGAGSGCSLLVDRSTAQCHVDSDCLRFGGHPLCQNGICVASGLGPEGCVTTPPMGQADYLNACTVAANVPFDNCARLGLCGSQS